MEQRALWHNRSRLARWLPVKAPGRIALILALEIVNPALVLGMFIARIWMPALVKPISPWGPKGYIHQVGKGRES